MSKLAISKWGMLKSTAAAPFAASTFSGIASARLGQGTVRCHNLNVPEIDRQETYNGVVSGPVFAGQP